MKSLYQLLSIMLSKELWCQPLRTNVSASKAHIISFVLKQKPVQKRRLLFQALVLASDQFSILGAARVFIYFIFSHLKKKKFQLVPLWCCESLSVIVSKLGRFGCLQPRMQIWGKKKKKITFYFFVFFSRSVIMHHSFCQCFLAICVSTRNPAKIEKIFGLFLFPLFRQCILKSSLIPTLHEDCSTGVQN